MLKVKTFLDRSLVHGIGLFASEAIVAGQEVWAFHPKIDLAIKLDDWQTIGEEVAEPAFQQIRQLAYKEDNQMYICLDNAQFMNHCSSATNIGNLKITNSMVATRDISPGEELLCNYYEFCDHDDEGLQHISQLVEEQ